MLGKRIFELGEAIHGSQKEKTILNLIKEYLSTRYTNYKEYQIKTKEWRIEEFSFRVNGSEVRASLLPYTSGYVKGEVGKEIAFSTMPEHPFLVSSVHEENSKSYQASVFYDQGKLRRIGVKGEKPALFSSVPLKQGDKVEIYAEGSLIETTSYNLEFTLQEGEDYVIIGAHVDHWLSGYHDNIFSIDFLSSLNFPNLKHGLKLIFFSSEEGPRCCNGSFQHPKDDVFIMISLDALFPNRVVFSATPDLWELSRFFNVKRIEMPTPFSDHFPYVIEGFPAMVLYNDDLIPWYHSDMDLPVEQDILFSKELEKSFLKFLQALDKMSKSELDERFFKYAESRGVSIKGRKGSIVPYGLNSRLKNEK
ncbi:Zn-dependent exopeptidase M28 [Stygiolobus caldivivus]|uniref:Zn-dependent exopeptidase M28 n=1 Tax=Stygiolobus caldivivus TaxID=2824673 RepID=A0A8D5U989_9CREN|nr:Zn-dependent exopeptidase M28 [Stygiolobus caldivivus]BCU71228.1 Zn-dependent exopeptidase M28 [Stygiolobus caldivivus]